VNEPLNDTDKEQRHDDSDEVPVVQLVNDLTHDTKTLSVVVMAESVSENEQENPACEDEDSGIIQGDTTDSLRTPCLRVATLRGERTVTDVLPIRRLRTESHTSRPLVERGSVLDLHKLRNNLKGRSRRTRGHLELKQRTTRVFSHESR
jgi:hypothetical protein